MAISSVPPPSRKPRFDSPEQEAFLNLWRTYDCLKALEEELFARFQLSAQQYNALRLLRSVYPASIQTLALGKLLISRSPDTTRMLDRLEQRQLIIRERRIENRRVVEVAITKEQLAALWPMTEGRRMSKVTHKIDVAEIPFTLDRYEGQLDWLNIAEAVFPGPTAAESFTPPPWFKREVSDLPAYRHSNLARE